MLRRRMKTSNTQQYNWIDLKCPQCGSYNIIKVEEKVPCTNKDCLDKYESCTFKVCDKSVELVTMGRIQQKFKCRNCSYSFTELRRVM